ERMSVRRCAHDRLSGDIAGSTQPVLDDEWLAEPFQPLTNQARKDVRRAARCNANNDAHRPRRKGLRPCHTTCCRERSNTRCQTQESTAWMLTHQPPVVATRHGPMPRRCSLAK